MPAPFIDPQAFATLQAKAASIGIHLAISSAENGEEALIASRQPLGRQQDHLECWILGSAEEVERLLAELGRLSASNAALQRNKKADATFIARAALAGFELVRLADGSWFASRWGMFRGLADDVEVERFLSVVGAPE